MPGKPASEVGSHLRWYATLGSEVSIRIVGPEIPSRHSGRVTPESAPAFFSHDGTTLSFAMGRRGAQLAENVRPVLGEPTAAIEHAIAQMAASYFADIEAAAKPAAQSIRIA